MSSWTKSHDGWKLLLLLLYYERDVTIDTYRCVQELEVYPGAWEIDEDSGEQVIVRDAPDTIKDHVEVSQ